MSLSLEDPGLEGAAREARPHLIAASRSFGRPPRAALNAVLLAPPPESRGVDAQYSRRVFQPRSSTVASVQAIFLAVDMTARISELKLST